MVSYILQLSLHYIINIIHDSSPKRLKRVNDDLICPSFLRNSAIVWGMFNSSGISMFYFVAFVFPRAQGRRGHVFRVAFGLSADD